MTLLYIDCCLCAGGEPSYTSSHVPTSCRRRTHWPANCVWSRSCRVLATSWRMTSSTSRCVFTKVPAAASTRASTQSRSALAGAAAMAHTHWPLPVCRTTSRHAWRAVEENGATDATAGTAATAVIAAWATCRWPGTPCLATSNGATATCATR